MTSTAIDRAAAVSATYPIDERLHGALREAIEEGAQEAAAAARLALNIRDHKHFRALAIRMMGITIAPSSRGSARTEKTALLGTPERGSALAAAAALARLIVGDLGLPRGQRANAAALALVLAEESTRPAQGKRSAHRAT